MTMDDVFDMWAQVCAQGFIPDTLLVHPMAWIMWVKDPVLREFALQNGGGGFFAQFGGNPAAQKTNWYNFNGLGLGNGQKTVATQGTQSQPATTADLPQGLETKPQLPNYLGLPFRGRCKGRRVRRRRLCLHQLGWYRPGPARHAA